MWLASLRADSELFFLFGGWRLIFRTFDGWRLTPLRPSNTFFLRETNKEKERDQYSPITYCEISIIPVAINILYSFIFCDPQHDPTILQYGALKCFSRAFDWAVNNAASTLATTSNEEFPENISGCILVPGTNILRYSPCAKCIRYAISD